MYWLQDPLFVFERAFHLLLQSMNKIEKRFKFLFKLKSWSTTNFDSSFTLSWMFFSNWDWFVQKINAIQEQKLPVLSFCSIFSYCQSTSLPMQMIKKLWRSNFVQYQHSYSSSCKPILPSHQLQHILPPILGQFQIALGCKAPRLVVEAYLQAFSTSPCCFENITSWEHTTSPRYFHFALLINN